MTYFFLPKASVFWPKKMSWVYGCARTHALQTRLTLQPYLCFLGFIIWIEHNLCVGLVKKLVQGELGNSVHKTHREAEDDDNESIGDDVNIDDDGDGGDGDNDNVSDDHVNIDGEGCDDGDEDESKTSAHTLCAQFLFADLFNPHNHPM